MPSDRISLDFADSWEDFFESFPWDEILTLLKKYPDLFSWVDKYNDDAVSWIVCTCDYSMAVKEILLRRVLGSYDKTNLNTANKYGDTPLSLACQSREAYIFIKILCEYGANPKIPKNGYGQPLGRLMESLDNKPIDDLFKAIDFLMDHGARLNFEADDYSITPFQSACAYGGPDIIRFLYKRGAKIELGGDDETPLTTAVRRNKYENVVCLLELGANVNGTESTFPYTALDIAHDKKDQRMIDLLTKHGGKTNMREIKQWLSTAIAATGDKSYKKKKR